MESYLELFEQAIEKQAELVGVEKARSQAERAGLMVSPAGHIVSCTGNPTLVLLRLVKRFAEDGNLAALSACSPLINKLTKIPAELAETSD